MGRKRLDESLSLSRLLKSFEHRGTERPNFGGLMFDKGEVRPIPSASDNASPGELLAPGVRVALAIFELELRVAEAEAMVLPTETTMELADAYETGQRMRGATFALKLLRKEAKRMGIEL